MQKINYRTTYIILYMIGVMFSLFIIGYFSEIKDKTNIKTISSLKIEEKFKTHEELIHEYFEKYENALISLSKNKNLIEYITSNKNEETVKETFLTLNNSFENSFQLRYIDKDGYEKVKIRRDYNLRNNPSIITPNNLLQNKANRYYFHRFINLTKDNVGISKIDLRREFGKEVLPKVSLLRLATPVYDKDDKKNGFVVFSINLETLFNTIRKSTLYDIYLIDNKQRFILHPDDKKGILSNSFKTYLLNDEFGLENAKEIISNLEMKNNDYYSKKISNLNTGQGLKLILKSKFTALLNEQKENEYSIYAILIAISFILLPLIFYFASIPEKLKGKIHTQAITDPITQLPNRACLFHDLNRKKFEDSIIILIHIDNYDKVQDAYGFKIAEELIKESALFLKQFEYKNSFSKLYKISKATFAFKYHFKTKSKLLSSLDNIHYRLENESFQVINGNFEVLVNSTIAVSNTEKLNNSIEELKEAEIALSDALKEKVDINIYDNTEKKNIQINQENILMVNKIKKAIENDNVIVQFQAIYNNNKNCIDKYETLIRLKIDDKLIFPGEFLDIAKETKKYKKLTMIVIDKSFEYFKDKKDIQFSINLSIEDISDKKIRKHLFNKIKEYDIKDRLVLEIVETEAIDNYENFFFFIKKAKEYGCQIAIDDFGSGYSNYEYIVKLSDYIDFLKIDGSLIIGLDKNSKRQLLIGTLKFLCDNLNIKTIAEYVESKELFDYVKSMGIDYSQGYYIGRSEDEIKIA
ncbi:EAL domain-containing protein [Arcobacter roscoffensis]|uniref:EAL domain-containing protein n=1 Tax=Arcobacter roscoffensis TaxID=2961520 RepID=A0ABY5EAW6_9BACT|nr:EAL domain-containing protein [Arcobacter roscoffensis]UTJ07865.1 EAL domain-containing protein [Arcobacter roscoffensis]